MTDVHFPFVFGVGNETVDVSKFAHHGLRECDFNFLQLQQCGHTSCNHGVNTMVQVLG